MNGNCELNVDNIIIKDMGNNESEGVHHNLELKKKYVRMLTKCQQAFIKEGIEEENKRQKIMFNTSIIGEDLLGNVDWKTVFEAYLDEKKETYFWANEMLE